MGAHQVRALLMGGQACVFYGAAEFSRDTDLLVLADAENLQRLEQFELLEARRVRGARPTSAKRSNVNSRGCQPTEPRRRTLPTLEGSHNECSGPFVAGSNATAAPRAPSHDTTTQNLFEPQRVTQRMVRPFQGRIKIHRGSVGCTHGYSR